MFEKREIESKVRLCIPVQLQFRVMGENSQKVLLFHKSMRSAMCKDYLVLDLKISTVQAKSGVCVVNVFSVSEGIVSKIT